MGVEHVRTTEPRRSGGTWEVMGRVGTCGALSGTHLQVGHVGIVREDNRAEVDELEDATLRVDDADVGRLDVAVRDAEVGKEGERVEHLDGEGPDRACVPVLSARARAKCLEVHVVRQDGRVEALVHEKEVLAVVEAVEQPHNVPAAEWVMQPDQRLNPGLAQPGIHRILCVL